MGPSGPASGDQGYIVIAAPPEATEANLLADGLRALGWPVTVAADVAPYARAARACVALVTPQTINGPALQSALSSNPRNLIPVLTVPMPLPYGPWAGPPIFMGESAQQAASAVANAVLSLTAAAPFAPTQPVMGYQPTPAPPKARSRKPLVIGLGIALAVIVLLCAGAVGVILTRKVELPLSALSGVSTPTPTFTPAPTPTATVPPGFTAYTDPSGRFKLITPNGWATSSTATVTTFVGISPAAILEIASQNTPISDADIATNEAAFFRTISTGAGGSGSYTIVEKATPVTLGGVTWTKETGDISVKGETLRAVVLIANHNGGAYVIGCATTQSAFSKIDAEDFQPMLQSFQFVS